MKKVILVGALVTVVSLTQAQAQDLGKKILTNTKEKAKSRTEQEADKQWIRL
ncbi:MAG: hypothetical protein ACQUHE_11860 [Bacteroidia bacterium]